MTICDRVKSITRQLPGDVRLVAATKTRTVEEILQAIDAGIQIIGENYVQEAEQKIRSIGNKAEWHMLGHLQKNKADKALKIFDKVQTVDNLKLAAALNKTALKKGIKYPVFVEINSASEPQKAGVLPEKTADLIKAIDGLENIRIEGIMTMGPFFENPESIRPYFKLTKQLFDDIKDMKTGTACIKYLSMGMSSSWRVAIEEGANMIRIGTGIFGER